MEISEEDGIRYLHLGSDTIQSGMRINAPDELVLAYTRSMMSFLLFGPEPARVLSIGLGGGSVNKWIYRHLPGSRLVSAPEADARAVKALGADSFLFRCRQFDVNYRRLIDTELSALGADRETLRKLRGVEELP